LPEILKRAYQEGSQEESSILGELPPELTRSILREVQRSAEEATAISSQIIAYRERIRKFLIKNRLLRKYVNGRPINLSNIAAVDGTYSVISTTLYDIIFVGTVTYSYRIDGLDSKMYAIVAPPSILSEKIARGLMIWLEFKTAAEFLNSYEFIILDGSIIANIANIRELIAAREQNPEDPIWESNELMALLNELKRSRALSKILKVPGVIASPKKLTGKLFTKKYLKDFKLSTTDASVLSLTLDPGEWIKISWMGNDLPQISLEMPRTDITPVDANFVETFFSSTGFDIIYFKPREWSRVFKIEVPGRLRNDYYQKVLDLVYHQVNSPYIEELEIQYLSHLFASKLSKVAQIIFTAAKNGSLQMMAKKWCSAIFLATRYRT